MSFIVAAPCEASVRLGVNRRRRAAAEGLVRTLGRIEAEGRPQTHVGLAVVGVVVQVDLLVLDAPPSPYDADVAQRSPCGTQLRRQITKRGYVWASAS
ncbi:MAG: hypothetical protein JNL18_08735 [Planctomycetaceae bacterium]|nr:hypothetical protein [Planctomycetaceae bacterium]